MGNILLPADGITIRQGIYEESSTQKTELGRFIDFEDGRRFRYCKADGAITKGHMCQSPAIDSDHTEVVQTGYGITAGDKDNISVLLSAAPSANQYADGFLICNKGTGLGQIYKIKKNTAAYDPCKIWLYDKVITTIAETAEITLIKNKYLDVVVAPTTVSGAPVGIPLISVTDDYYFWAQSRGYAPLVVDDSSTLVVGDRVIFGGTDEGAGDPAADDTSVSYGTVIYVATADEYAIVDLHLE